MSVPTRWFERKQTPRIPNETVWVSGSGEMHFPDEMASDHIVNALNKLIRSKRDKLTLAGLAAESESARARLLAHAADKQYLRSLVLSEFPVAAEMEAVFVARQEALKHA